MSILRLQDYAVRAVEHRPNSVAFSMSGESITYGELNSQSNRIAHLLLDAGCRPGDRVVLLCQKSLPTLTALLATLKAGCTYVPLDPDSPPARLARILGTSEPAVALVDDKGASLINELESRSGFAVIGLDAAAGKTSDVGRTISDASSFPDTPPMLEDSKPAPAALLYTSGSTGEPKGVPVSHHSIIAFVDWAVEHFGMQPGDRCSSHAPLFFDLSFFDVFGSIAAMAHCSVVPHKLNLLPASLANFIRDEQLTQWFSVPSAIVYMAQSGAIKQDDFPDLKRMLWCGEVLPNAVLKSLVEWLPGKKFTNLYGPTEAAIASSYFDVPTPDVPDPLPIGYPCAGEDLLVLDEQLRPVEQGQIGDLYIGGIGLTDGYWRDAQKTAAQFVEYDSKNGLTQRLFRTGDLASIGESGLLHFHGRMDSQIKSRGYRIELGEIESAIANLDGIVDSIVAAVDIDDFGSKAICAALVVENNEIEIAKLRQELRQRLPEYMLPRRWLILEALPLTPNGKRSRSAIERMFREERDSGVVGMTASLKGVD